MLELVLPLIKLGWRVKQINVVVTNLFISKTKLAYVDTRFQKKIYTKEEENKSYLLRLFIAHTSNSSFSILFS